MGEPASGLFFRDYLMDARTGLGRFREFRISNYTLMMDLIKYCRNHNIDEILELADVKERVELYFEQAEKAKDNSDNGIGEFPERLLALNALDLRRIPRRYSPCCPWSGRHFPFAFR